MISRYERILSNQSRTEPSWTLTKEEEKNQQAKLNEINENIATIRKKQSKIYN